MDKSIDFDRVAHYYDLYVTTRLDVPFWVEEGRRAGGPVLELMSGTGRVSLPLASAGVTLTCVDYSAACLAILRSKLEAAGLSATVVEADARELALGRTFRAAFVPFNSFMEITDPTGQTAVLRAIHRHLEPRGELICTLHNPPVRKRSVTGAPERLGTFSIPGSRRTLTVTGTYSLAPGTSVVRGSQTYVEAEPDGSIHSSVELPVSFRLVEREQFEQMAIATGFEITEFFGDYDRTPFEPSSSPFMVIRLRCS